MRARACAAPGRRVGVDGRAGGSPLLPDVRTALRLATIGFGCLVLANCSASHRGSGVDSKYGVKASPRVVQPGEPVPKGGGRRQASKPYVVAGKTYVPKADASGYSRTGIASWYGSAFHGRLTSNGEVFDSGSLSAAHPTLPVPSYARVTNLENGRAITVRINDRGPYHGNRLIDVSQKTAQVLGFHRAGTTKVRVDYVGEAGLGGSDDRKLMATYRENGERAPLQRDRQIAARSDLRESEGRRQPPAPTAPPVQVAALEPPPVVAPARPVRHAPEPAPSGRQAPVGAPLVLAPAMPQPRPQAAPVQVASYPPPGVYVPPVRLAPMVAQPRPAPTRVAQAAPIRGPGGQPVLGAWVVGPQPVRAASMGVMTGTGY